MDAVVEQGGPDDDRDVERVLGVLASLSASADETIAFVAPRGTSWIVDRALAVMARSDRYAARAQRARHRT
jgi:hypothetical protein